MKNVILLLVAVLSIAACKKEIPATIEAVDTLKPVKDSLSHVLDSIYKNDSTLIGFSVALLTKDTVLYNKGFGYADVSANKKYTGKTIQNIGSISKTFIGVALLKAHELGLLQLDDPIERYIPFKVNNPKYSANPITIRQLATHTSSIVDTDWYGKSYVMLHNTHNENTKVLDYFNKPKGDMPMATYLENVLDKNGKWYEPEIFETYAPGAAFNYSNIGATLAALVIEGAAKESFSDFTTTHILKPLNMKASGWFHEAIDSTQRSKAYVAKDTLIAPYKLITYPDGGMITSTYDLSLYFTELMKGYYGEGTILTKDSYQELFKKQLAPGQLNKDKPEDNTGIFIDFSKYGIGHNGGDPAVLTFMYFDADSGMGKILFTNTDYDTNPEVIRTFMKIWKTLGSYEEKFIL